MKLVIYNFIDLSCNTFAAIIVHNAFDLTPSQNIYYFFSEVIYYCWWKAHHKIVSDEPPHHVFILTPSQNNYHSFSEVTHQAMEQKINFEAAINIRQFLVDVSIYQSLILGQTIYYVRGRWSRIEKRGKDISKVKKVSFKIKIRTRNITYFFLKP